jgi:hypothetical protein
MLWLFFYKAMYLGGQAGAGGLWVWGRFFGEICGVCLKIKIKRGTRQGQARKVGKNV